MTIENISDTARWVAVYRAMETDRPDAIFRDPYARRLAGVKGQEIVDTMKRGRSMAWAMIVRTAMFDEQLMQRVRAGADMVINLAAGLDTRPWRLDLPANLRWVDVDLPGILEHKLDELKNEKPRCRYEPVKLDLRETDKRDALFARLGAEAKNVVVLTEGLLIYLEPEQVADLARALARPPSFRSWVIDIASPMLIKWSARSWGKELEKANSPFKFGPAESTKFFEPFGWRETHYENSADSGRRLNRQMAGAGFWRVVGAVFGVFQSKAKREQWKRFGGVALLERA